MKSVEYILYAISIGISWDFIGIDWECKIEYIIYIYISNPNYSSVSENWLHPQNCCLSRDNDD